MIREITTNIGVHIVMSTDDKGLFNIVCTTQHGVIDGFCFGIKLVDVANSIFTSFVIQHTRP